jgi:pyruvate kinase
MNENRPMKRDPDEVALDLRSLRDDVAALRESVVGDGAARLSRWGEDSDRARNIAHYLALRSHDLNELQLRLSTYGLSSLGRSEADVLAALDALLATLRRLCGEHASYPAATRRREGEHALACACQQVFGADEDPRRTRIMATLPTEAADDPKLISDLIEAGMDCARVNCAHDDAAAWGRMVDNIHAASQRLDRPCKILMDIAGPKLRVEKVAAPDKYRLHPGQRLSLLGSLDDAPGVAFSLNMPEVVAQLREGAEVSFDDGKAVGRVVAAKDGAVEIEIVAARTKGVRLKPGKGVNLPATELDLPPLTKKDLADLDFVAAHADLVGLSFVQRPADVDLLREHLSARRGARPPQTLVLKIETALSIRNLPDLIVRAAATGPAAVMIARGDLAVELGFARLSEMQEEILWLCEAAHAPVIWATQVLDQLVHEGVASRAEATDAAMAQKADCVMLNKGEFLTGGVRFLRDVLDRMERHHAKKFARLSQLQAWR